MKNYKTYSLWRTNLSKFLFFFTVVLIFSCARKNYSSNEEYQFHSKNNLPDYADLNYWAAHPWKKNTSDSIPKPLRVNFKRDSSVDVFFLYPTSLTSKKDDRWNAPIDDALINAKTDYSSILYQASVFNESCRIFAPRYRQAHINAFFIPQDEAQKYFDTAYEDIRNAFIYYLKNFNNGRPIIIASHSQGTKHAARLLKEFFEDKPMQNKLVCAYIIGLPIPEKYFTTLKPCSDSASTGCIVSWRTYARGYTEPNFVAKENFKAIVINPLSWTSDTLLIPSSKNKGGVLLKFNKIIPHTVNANIHHNVLWTCKPNIFGKIFLKQKNYHIGDINLFYMNLRQNVKTRIAAYWKR
jgi:hypothetical protein